MSISTKILLGFALVIIISVTDSFTNYRLSQKVERNISFLTHSEAVIRNSGQIQRGIVEMQAAFRGYLLTDDEAFLEPYQTGLKSIPNLIVEQKQLVAGSASQSEKLNSIVSFHRLWITYADGLIRSKKASLQSIKAKASYQEMFDNKLKKQVGRKLNTRISDQFREFDQLEYRLRETRRAQLRESISITHITSLIFLVLTLMAGATTVWLIIKSITGRIAAMATQAARISRNDFAIIKEIGKDELSRLADSLNIMSANLNSNMNELQKKNQELNQFAYVVSHDLKAPLRGIYNVLNWINEDLHDKLTIEMRQYLDIIGNRIKRMEDLIHGLLDYAKAGSEKLNKEEVDTAELVKQLAETLLPKEFSFYQINMPVIRTEKIKLEQVFSNLISNAVKYVGHPSGKVTISCEVIKNFYEFKVKDNGIGIDPKFHDKVFELFQTLREKDDKESTGIGLAIVKKIIEDNKGTIKIISYPEKGASFIFTWPK